MNKLTSKLRLFASLSATMLVLNGCAAALIDTEALKEEAAFLENATKIDARVDATLEQLYQTHPIRGTWPTGRGYFDNAPYNRSQFWHWRFLRARGPARGRRDGRILSVASAGYGWQLGAQQCACVIFHERESIRRFSQFRRLDCRRRY